MVPLIPALRPQLLVNSRLVEGGKLDGSAHPSPVQTGRTSLPLSSTNRTHLSLSPKTFPHAPPYRANAGARAELVAPLLKEGVTVPPCDRTALRTNRPANEPRAPRA